MIVFPHDYAAIERDADWRDQALLAHVLSRPARCDDGLRPQASARRTLCLRTRSSGKPMWPLCSSSPLGRCALVEAANTLDGLQGVAFTTDLPEILFLSGRSQSNPGASGIDKLIRIGSCRRPLARQIAWTAEWTPLLRLPAALADPEVVAFNRNPELIRTAQASRRRIRYDNVESYYAELLKAPREETEGRMGRRCCARAARRHAGRPTDC